MINDIIRTRPWTRAAGVPGGFPVPRVFVYISRPSGNGVRGTHPNPFLLPARSKIVFIDDPMIRTGPLQERGYQRTLAKVCLNCPTLIVLPTGLGKTVIALQVAAEVLHRRTGKVLFLAPTRPLVEQHAEFMSKNLVGVKVVMMTGEKRPMERSLDWSKNDVIVSTPQVIANDLGRGRLDLNDVGIIIFDEAHRGVGNYAYVKIAKAYQQTNGLVMGITASPGTTKGKIGTLLGNLGIRNIEIRTEQDEDVSPCVHDIVMERIEVEVPPRTKELTSVLHDMQGSYSQVPGQHEDDERR